MCNKNHFNKVLILTAALLSSVVSAADWNFNDPSKLASGEVSVPGVTLLTAGKTLSTSNVAIAAGSYIGQIIPIAVDKATFLSINNIDSESFAFLSGAVDGKINISGSKLAAATGASTVSLSSSNQLVKRVVINTFTFTVPNTLYASGRTGSYATGVFVGNGETCQLHNPGLLKINSGGNFIVAGVVLDVRVVSGQCVLKYYTEQLQNQGFFYGESRAPSGNLASLSGSFALGETSLPVIDVVRTSVAGSGDIAIRIN
ncbi:hypothetical protein OKT24_18400 [Aeromonas veronii]|nr:hypothetical protein [Aeromonas veronii]